MDTMSEGRPARLALIGAGAIASSYLAAFAESTTARLVAIADTDISAARRLADPLGLPAYRGHGDLLAACDVEGAIVCTPPSSHMEIAIDALGAGVHVLCEKPLAIGAFSARRMFAAADAAARILTMASKFRFVADLRRARDFIESGLIGEILRVDNTFMAPVDMTGRWNSRAALSGGGVLIDNGTHSVDIMRFFIGPLVAVFAVDSSSDPRYRECDDSANVFVRNAAGVIGSIALSWSLGTTDPAFLRIHGTDGTIDVGWRESRYCRTGEGSVVFGSGYDKRAAFRAQIDDFAGAVAGRHAPAVGSQDAIASVETIDAAYASIGKNTWATIEGRRYAMPVLIA